MYPVKDTFSLSRKTYYAYDLFTNQYGGVKIKKYFEQLLKF